MNPLKEINISKELESKIGIKKFLKKPHTKKDIVNLKWNLENRNLPALARYVTSRLVTFDKHIQLLFVKTIDNSCFNVIFALNKII